MGYFIRPAGGGTGNDLTVPTGAVTLDANTNTYSVNLVNTGTTPASVELSFQNSKFKGLDPDSGTETSPTYVVDPDTGSRSITIERTTVSTSNDSERVTFTSNQGNTQFLDFTLEPLNIHFALRLLRSADPIFEFRFDGNFNDTGTNATGALATVGTPTAVASTSDRTGLVGYVDSAGTTYGYINNASVDINTISTPRSWIWTGKLNSTFGAAHTIAWGIMQNSPSGAATNGVSNFQWYGPSSYWRNFISTYSNNPLLFDTSKSHTDGGASVEISNVSGCEILLAFIHDGSSTVTVRWKTKNGNTERSGHSFTSETRTAKSNISYPQIFGWVGTGGSPAGSDIRTGHVSVYDSALTADDFTTISALVGF